MLFMAMRALNEVKGMKLNMTTSDYVNMWDNWSKKRSSIPVYDLWLDEYKDILEKK